MLFLQLSGKFFSLYIRKTGDDRMLVNVACADRVGH